MKRIKKIIIWLFLLIMLLQAILMYRIVDKIIEIENHIKVQEKNG